MLANILLGPRFFGLGDLASRLPARGANRSSSIDQGSAHELVTSPLRVPPRSELQRNQAPTVRRHSSPGHSAWVSGDKGHLWALKARSIGRGRRTILWSAIDHQDEELMEEETAESEEPRRRLSTL